MFHLRTLLSAGDLRPTGFQLPITLSDGAVQDNPLPGYVPPFGLLRERNR